MVAKLGFGVVENFFPVHMICNVISMDTDLSQILEHSCHQVTETQIKLCFFAGLLDKLSYIKDDVKSKAIYLNPIYPSGGEDTGYDISNHTDIDELFGDLDSFKHLVHSMHKKGRSPSQF